MAPGQCAEHFYCIFTCFSFLVFPTYPLPHSPATLHCWSFVFLFKLLRLVEITELEPGEFPFFSAREVILRTNQFVFVFNKVCVYQPPPYLKDLRTVNLKVWEDHIAESFLCLYFFVFLCLLALSLISRTLQRFWSLLPHERKTDSDSNKQKVKCWKMWKIYDP